MTLQEVHEIQRREFMSLRAEKARLKKPSSGLVPVEEKEKLERHIRHASANTPYQTTQDTF